MPAKFWTDDKLEVMRSEILPANGTLAGAISEASRRWPDVPRDPRSLQSNFRRAFGLGPGGLLARGGVPIGDSIKAARIRQLEGELAELRQRTAYENRVLRLLGAAADRTPQPPAWLTRERGGWNGVPTLMLSDIHHGEIVFPEQLQYANEFNRDISERRVLGTASKALHLLTDVFSRRDYPGIVLALGGDLVSGLIHEELREHSSPIFEQVLDLHDILIAVITQLHDALGQVYVPAVVGNHGRIDRKPRAKGGPVDNFEWLLYQLLRKHFARERAIHIHPATGFDQRYRIYGVRYLLTHGDRFKGGSGISGPAVPWAIGDARLRRQAGALEAWTKRPAEFDVMVFGHWHQSNIGQGQRWIANGSVKGWDEYAAKNNYPFEPPTQNLWLTHPRHRVTFLAPVHCDELAEPTEEERRQWVSWME